jgi:hypothetical protein
VPCTLPPSPGWAEFTIMMECTPENGHCQYIYTLATVGVLNIDKIVYFFHLRKLKIIPRTLNEIVLSLIPPL